MKPFTKTELKHLKYKMIKERGMSPEEANNEIALLLKCNKESHDLALKKKKAQRKASNNFQEDFKQLIEGEPCKN